MEKDERFVKGLLCGVVLVLVCMALSMGLSRWRMSRSLGNISGDASEGKTQESSLTLDEQKIETKMEEIQSLINAYYLDGVDSTLVEEGIYQGAISGLEDPYSVYYSAEALEDMEESTSGTYSGIGAVMSQDPETMEIYVVQCFENTPSYEAGLLAGDVVVSLNGEEIKDMDLSELVSKIKTEEGESITLGIRRDGEELEKQIERRNIEIPTVECEMLENGIGYLRILEFDTVTEEQFTAALEELEEDGMEKLIVDVRDNPGGILQVVCEVLDEMLPEGLIVYTEDKNGNREEYFSDEEHQFEKPLVVLVNENSASAAEIFSGAIQDYGLGTLVGTTTFGKGIVQRIFNLSDGTGIKLTIAKYYTPNGNDIHEKGIEPDVAVEMGENEEMDENDPQLEEAIRILEEAQD